VFGLVPNQTAITLNSPFACGQPVYEFNFILIVSKICQKVS